MRRTRRNSAKDPHGDTGHGGHPSAAVAGLAARLLYLQRTSGNRAVSQLLAPSPPADVRVQRVLMWGGKRIAVWEDLPAEVQAGLVHETDGNDRMFVRPIVEAMIDEGVDHEPSVHSIAQAIPKIVALFLGLPPPDQLPLDGPWVRVLRRLTDDELQPAVLKAFGVETKNAGAIPGRNLRGFNRLLDENPALVDHLRKARITIRFSSGEAKHLGGLYTPADRTVHLEADANTSEPGVFLRLLLHEMGHATFQQMLTGNTGAPGVLSEYETVFRAAWEVLRRNDGQYLLGLDLGPGRGPAARKKYQAGSFLEFCAENFMHRVTASNADQQAGQRYPGGRTAGLAGRHRGPGQL